MRDNRYFVSASYVLGGFRRTPTTDTDLLSAVQEGLAASPIAEVTVRRHSDAPDTEETKSLLLSQISAMRAKVHELLEAQGQIVPVLNGEYLPADWVRQIADEVLAIHTKELESPKD